MRGGYDVPSADIAAASADAAGLAGRTDAAPEQRARALPREARTRGGASRLREQHAADAGRRTPACPRACRHLARSREARAVLSPFWRTEKLGAARRTAHHQGVRRHHSGRRPPRPHGAHALCRAHQLGRARGRASPAPKPLAKAWTAVIRGAEERASAAQGGAGRAALGRLLLSPRRSFCGSKKKFAEAAAVMLKAPTDRASRRRCRRMVARTARAVARTGRPRRHEDRLSHRRGACGREPDQRRRCRIPRRLVRVSRTERCQDRREALRPHRRDRGRADLAGARLLLARPRSRGRRAGRRQGLLPQGGGPRHDVLRPARRRTHRRQGAQCRLPRAVRRRPRRLRAPRGGARDQAAGAVRLPDARGHALPGTRRRHHKSPANWRFLPPWPKSAATTSWR